ncbi:MAG: SDR family oxidoreductase [Hyphomicrobiales bacterium]|nr:SDR family oxidoreductase [Hyphomicrobiales bacterium]MCP5370534.1 SDR family oxidoreductase [Hyphomicrobiales bacterium]
MPDSVLVTGGSGGIGGAACRALAARGYRPLVGYRSGVDRAQKLAEETGGLALRLDLDDGDSIDAAVAAALDAGPLAGAVLAASPPPVLLPLFQARGEEAARHWRTTVDGHWRLLDGLVKGALRKRRRGCVVGVLTRAMGLEEGVPAARTMGAYVVAKYGLLGLLRALAAEFPWLTVRTVEPDFTETAMLDVFDPRFLESLRAARPGGRFDDPARVAAEIAGAFEEAEP